MLPKNIKCDAHLSDCNQYRYTLSRTWSSETSLLFIMLNPSTADALKDDATIRRCMAFAFSNGFGGISVVNLFALRTPSPRVLKASTIDPIGPENDHWIEKMMSTHKDVVAAWGNHGNFLNRSTTIRDRYQNLMCLSINGSGEPKHPLYISGKAKLTPYPIRPNE